MHGRNTERVSEMISPYDLKHYVIIPVLNDMAEIWGPKINTEASVHLLIGTAVAESVIGVDMRLKQINGPALGIYQMEPSTAKDIWDNYLAGKDEKTSFVRGLMEQHITEESYDQELMTNLRYATAMARLKYWRRPFRMPTNSKGIASLASIWKKHYNTILGKGDPRDFRLKFPQEVL